MSNIKIIKKEEASLQGTRNNYGTTNVTHSCKRNSKFSRSNDCEKSSTWKKYILIFFVRKPKGITVYRGDDVRKSWSLPKSEMAKMYDSKTVFTPSGEFSNAQFKETGDGKMVCI